MTNQRPKPCRRCGGSGLLDCNDPLDATVWCMTCYGTGQQPDDRQRKEDGDDRC